MGRAAGAQDSLRGVLDLSLERGCVSENGTAPFVSVVTTLESAFHVPGHTRGDHFTHGPSADSLQGGLCLFLSK